MATLGIELCDAGFHAASCKDGAATHLSVADANKLTDWPAFAYYDGQKYAYGRAAEDQWFVHPRRVAHTFWARLAHEPSALGPVGKAAPLSELAYHFFSDFLRRATTLAPTDKIVLAVPGSYLKDAASEEEKIGLLLGMAGELKLPLAGVMDMACAALCDTRAGGFNPSMPVAVIDLHLEGADITLFGTQDRLERKDFIHLPHAGYAPLLKHLTSTMGNRFLRHTAFDILEDGRIEQMFFRQTKDFLFSGAVENRFQINTAARTYEMLAKREQLASDAQPFVGTLVQGVQTFLQNSPHAAEPCTLALTDRAGRLPGLESRLRSVGFHRIVRLAPGAAACGAALVGESQMTLATDLADVPVETSVLLTLAHRSTAITWEARLQKLRQTAGPRLVPTHVILGGIGHAIGSASRYTIGLDGLGSDLALPSTFNGVDDCTIPLFREGGRLWYVDPVLRSSGGTAPAFRTPVEAGDSLMVRSGNASAELLFARCEGTNGARAHD